MRKLIIAVMLFSAFSAHAQVMIFKRTTDLIRPAPSDVEVEVWLTDATNLILSEINAEGRKIFETEAQQEFIESVKGRIDSEQLKMLVLVSFVANAKMKKYGITNLPAAVQVDRDGTVVRRAFGVHGIEELLGW